MALTARTCRGDRGVGAALTVLRGGKGRSTPRRPTARPAEQCRRLFFGASVVLLCVTAIGMGRVALTVKATEAAVAACSLTADIEAERIAIEQLEAYRSALVAPPRIQGLAETSMKMGAAGQVDYIELAAALPNAVDGAVDAGAEAASADGANRSERADAVAEVLSRVMRMTAGEAQVLLVGDAALTSSR
jgi:hypothetical protein